ncbi:Bacterial regulatory proteins, luxR family [Buttiauxella agrestis]|uniref:Bacterial regulatory proteins, luxR family n=1 Tax=Buttiauxella agrestis TaxID=82977 RepID=A0A381C865_9ENTR|nr:LuxR C-terminal-related transcriptional regulator [Buttiauxella agrestis]SUW64040.1 Bacterial regulatory proteins, luxR family [Buttiauxella agrestis]
MNIYVLTENYFLFNGIECALKSRPDCHCIQLKPDDERYPSIADKNDPQDIFIVVPEYTRLDFSMLMAINETNASVIIANNHYDWNVGGLFRFSTIPRRFYLSDLLKSIHLLKSAKNKEVRLPRITATEKKVLQLTIKGTPVTFIGSRLGMTVKTAYAHQRSVFKKLGIRKTRDIYMLPDKFIKYLCENSQPLRASTTH